jgi:SAM-dependent methyltransferase
MWTELQYRILRKISQGDSGFCSESGYEGKSKLGTLLGEDFFGRITGKVVIDFGCGSGSEAVEMAQKGAGHVTGIDIREEVLQEGRQKALAAGVLRTCMFGTSTADLADIVVSLDAFEHFADPAEMLRIMSTLITPTGEVLLSFGPTWYHPLGGHLFSVFPWAHIVCTEKALIRWRNTFRSDGATRFGEVSGGLNQMTIGRFEKLVAASPLRSTSLELVPIRQLRHFHNRLTREFTTAVVRCRLVKRT